MKNLISILLVLISLNVSACDVCGGISTPGTDGLLAGNQYHFIGIRTNYSAFESLHRNVFSQETIISQERFLRLSLAGRWQFAKKWNAQLSIPFHINEQTISTGNQQIQGFGDITLQFNWMPIYKKNEKAASNILIAGLGLKMPTGHYSMDPWENSNIIPGSGSWDPSATVTYRWSKKKISCLFENSFVFKTTNPVGYRFGNSFNSLATAFLTIKTKKEHKLLPSLGLGYQFTNVDRINGYFVTESFNSGHIFEGNLGLNFITKNWMFNTKWSFPIVQSLANGDVTSKGFVELNIHYLIQKK